MNTFINVHLHSIKYQLLLSPLVVFGILAPLFETPSLLILDLSTPTPPSDPISKLTCSVLQAFLACNNTNHALLIHIYMLILAPKLFYITLQLQIYISVLSC